MPRYVVCVFDRCGCLSETIATDFAHAVSIAGVLTKQHPREVVRAFNNDQCDLDFDGLTDEERDAIDEAIVSTRSRA